MQFEDILKFPIPLGVVVTAAATLIPGAFMYGRMLLKERAEAAKERAEAARADLEELRRKYDDQKSLVGDTRVLNSKILALEDALIRLGRDRTDDREGAVVLVKPNSGCYIGVTAVRGIPDGPDEGMSSV